MNNPADDSERDVSRDKSLDQHTNAMLELPNAIIDFQPTRLHVRILDIAYDLIKNHQPLDSISLYSSCRNKLKDEDISALNKAVAEMFQMKILVHGKVLTGENLLDNKNRNDIFKLVKLHPGINRSGIKKALGSSIGTVRWHLNMLEEFSAIRSKRLENQKVYFSLSSDATLDHFYFQLNKNHVLKILLKIIEKPEISFTSLLNSLTIERNTLLRKIQDLASNKILTVIHDSNKIVSLRIIERYKPLVLKFADQSPQI